MEEFKNTIRAVCVISAGICILGYFVSGTKFRGQLKLILNIMLAIVIVSPFLKNRDGFDIDIPELTDSISSFDTKEQYNEEILRKTGENISEVLMQQVTAAGISCEKIETEVNISDDNSIFITKVTVQAEDFSKASEVIKDSIGQETEVVNGLC